MPYGAFVGDLYGMAAGNNKAETLKNGMRIPDIKPQEDDEEKKARPSEAAAAPPSIAAGSKPYSGRQRNMPADDGKAGEIGGQMAEAAPSSDMEAAISSVSSQMAIWFGGRYAFNSREKETFATMVQGSSDPVDTAGRYMAAVAISKRIGTTADRIYPNIDQISKYFTGNVYRAGDASLAEKVNASFESIEISDMKGEWMKIVRKDGFNDPKALALEAEIQQREEAIGGIQNAIPKGFWDGVANDIIGSLGYTMEGIKHGAAASTGVLAGTAPMIAPIAAANPIAGAAITATAGLWAGFAGTVSGFNRTRELTEYDTFWDLMHQTDAAGNMLARDVESASLIAGINGNITGFLESMADGIISRGINAFAPTVISRIGLPNLTVKVLTDGGVQGVRSRLAYAGVDWLLGGLNEGFVQEAPEQLATAVLTAAYRKTVGAEPDISLKQLASDFFSTGFRSTLVGLAYGGVGVPASMRQYSQTAFDLRRMANATPSEEAYFSRTKDMKPEGVPQADFDTARSQIYSAAKARREAVFGRREGTVMASEELAAEELYDTVNAETGEETGIMPDGTVYRDPESERLHTETRRENGRTRVYAGDRNTGAVYGYAEVTTDGDTLTVGSVRVRQGYEGIREELVREAISSQRTGESSIAWEPSTESLQKVKELLVQNNPRGSEAGLDYGSDLSINQDHDIEALSSSIRTAMPALSREESIVAARLYSIADSDGALSRLNEGQPVRNSDTLPERYRGAADGARAIIYTGKNSDFSTFYHELFHVNARQRPSEAKGLSNAIRTSMQDDASKANLRKFIEESREIWGEGFNADDVMQHLETIPADSDASQWSRAQFEDLARLAEAYATADNSKRTTLPEAIRNILRKIGEYMRKVYQTVTHAVPLPKEITEAYDVLMYNARASENAEVSNGLQYQDGNKTSGWKISKSMELVREKYSAAIPDKEAWDNKLAEDFFGQYRSEIEGLINEYEKVEVDGILMLSGMPSSDNPFQKELVQARFLKEITGSDVILLPRYSKQLLNSIFGVNLGKSSFADGVALIPDDNRFIEFKLCNNKNAGGYIGKAKGKGADGILIAINNNPTNLSAESFYSYWQDRIAGKDLAEGMDVYIFDINNGYLFTKNKETSSGLLDSPKGRTFGPRTDGAVPPTVLTLYARELREINSKNPEQPMDYSAYQQAELLHQEAYHGSPHSFDRFSTDHIGTGEGNQAFGWGLYVSDLEEVGRHYAEYAFTEEKKAEQIDQTRKWIAGEQKTLEQQRQQYEAEQGDEYWKDDKIYQALLTGDYASLPFARMRSRYEGIEPSQAANSYRQDRIEGSLHIIRATEARIQEHEARLAELESMPVQKRNFYRVSIPDNAKWLDWDGKAPKGIYNKLLKNPSFRQAIIDNWGSAEDARSFFSETAVFRLYNDITAVMGGDKEASLLLNSIGYAGIRYPVNSLSDRPSATDHNYVIFNADDIQIVDHLVYQDARTPDTSDLTEEQNEQREETKRADSAYVNGEDVDLDGFYDEYDASMDGIGDSYDAEEIARIYSEWAVEVDEAASDTNASLIDEDAVPYYDENTVNLMPDGSAAASQAEYERAVNSEVIPSMAESDGISMHGADDSDASASDPGIEPEPRHPGISYRDAYDEELSWNEFVDRNKPDIVYEGTDVKKDDRFIQAIQDDDTLMRYLGIIGEALYLNTRELNEDWHFGDQIQRERVKARVFDVITNTSIRNASLTAMKAGAGRTLSPRMYSLIRREMSSNARFYRNVLSWMMADDSMKPESLMKEPRGLDIPSRDALDAMPIQELRALAETAEDRDIVNQIERGTLRFEGGADEARGEEINAALESLARQVAEQQEELSRNEDTIDALESDLNAVQTALDERDRHIDSLVSTLQKVETIVRTGTKELTGETLEAYSFTPAMKKIASELSWLNKGRYEGLEAEHTKGKHGKYEVPKARREAREEYISMLTSFYPGIFEADGREFGKLDGIRDIYSPSGFDKVQEVLEARREELRAEWKEAAAAYADDLSAATWAASRNLSDSIDSTLGRIGSLEKEIGRQKRLKDTVKASRDRQLYDRTTRERWVAAKRARAAERRYEERIYDARTEERWKAAKRFLEREKELNQQIQDWKSFAAWQRKDLSEKARESTADAVNEAVTRERWLSAKKLNERTAELQREIDDWKSYARWERKDRKAERDAYIRKAKDDAALLADWMKAKADVRISELKAEQREKRRQERLYRRIREEKEKLGRVIARPVNLSTTDYETSAEAIMAIQALVDPHFRRDWTQDLENNLEGATGGGTMTIPEAVAYLQNLQEDDRNNILSILSPELAARLSGVRNPLNDWTVEQLRQLAEQTEELRRRGREVMRAKKAFERETRERIQKAIINAVREAGKRKGEELPDTVPGTAERVRQSQGVLAKLRSAKYITMRMQELAQLLDGGLGHRGAAYQLLVDEKRYHQSREWQAVDARMGKVAPYLTRKTVNELFEKVTLHLDGGFSRAFTINELAYVYLSQFDEDSRAAVAYGNLLTDTEKGTLMNAGRLDENGKFIPNAMSDGTIVNDEELQAIGDRRYHEAARIAALELERRGLMPLVEAIKEDFSNPENFRRLNSAAVEAYNTPMKKVQNYLPIMRQNLRGDNFRNDMADALFNLNTGDFNAALDKGMTISRIKIAPRHQRGVNLSLLEVWQKSVRNQEHLIEFAQYAKKVRGVFGSQATELVSMVDKVYSPGLMNEVQGYIDYVINPYSGQPRTNLDRTLRNLRGRTGAAYLGWKLPGVVLQFCTSAWPFLQDMSPAALLRGYLKLASGRGDAFNMIYEKSPMMKHRTMSTVVQEALERRGDANRSKAGRAMDRFNEVGQLGLTWVDKTLVAGGWLGAYETALQQNLEAGMDTALADAAAVKAADDVVLRTQPAGDSTELPSMFRNSNELVKIFLQFQSSLSVIWNNMVWDNIGFARNRQYGRIIASVVSYGMAGLMLGLVAEGFDDDDEAADRARKLGYWFMTQGIESFPVFGSDISLALQRIMTGERDFYGNGVDMFPGITKILSGIEDIVASDKPFMEGLRKVAEGAGIFAGAPVSGLKNLKRVAEEGPAALLGR